MRIDVEIIDCWKYLTHDQEEKVTSVQKLATSLARLDISRDELERWLAIKKSSGEIDMQYIASNCYIIPLDTNLQNQLKDEPNT